MPQANQQFDPPVGPEHSWEYKAEGLEADKPWLPCPAFMNLLIHTKIFMGERRFYMPVPWDHDGRGPKKMWRVEECPWDHHIRSFKDRFLLRNRPTRISLHVRPIGFAIPQILPQPRADAPGPAPHDDGHAEWEMVDPLASPPGAPADSEDPFIIDVPGSSDAPPDPVPLDSNLNSELGSGGGDLSLQEPAPVVNAEILGGAMADDGLPSNPIMGNQIIPTSDRPSRGVVKDRKNKPLGPSGNVGERQPWCGLGRFDFENKIKISNLFKKWWKP